MPEARDHPAVTQLRDRFELVGELGRGGMGVVFRARERHTGRDVALKVVLEGEASPKRLARFQREGELTARLNHPGIVRIHSSGVVGGIPFLAYELVEGGRTLREVFPEAPLARRVELLRDVARAVAHAHEHEVVHRDLKPANVLVDDSGRTQVADFGLATACDLERLTQSGTLLGSPSYLAPEQLEGSISRASAVDVWALGVMLYQALTDTLPFRGVNLAELIARIRRADPEPPRRLDPALPPDLAAYCLGVLQADPQRRPTAATLADQLDGYLAGRSLSSSRPSRWLVLGVLAPVVVAVAVVAATQARDPEPAQPPPTSSPPAPEVQVVDPLPRARELVTRGDPEALDWIRRAQDDPQAGKLLERFLKERTPAELERFATDQVAKVPEGQDDLVLAALCRRLGERSLRWDLRGARAGDLVCVDRLLSRLDGRQQAEIIKEVQGSESSSAADEFLLGRLYEVGSALPRDLKRAADLFRKGAAAGYAPALHNLALMIHYRWDGKPADLERIAALHRQAAAAGWTEAQMDLARLLIAGLIPPKGPKAIQTWLERAAKGGHSLARELLNTRRDPRQGPPTQLVLRADRGDARAMHDLGRLFITGEGVPVSVLATAYWLRLAAKQGHPRATRDLSQLMGRDLGDPDCAEVLALRAAEKPSVAKTIHVDLMHLALRRYRLGAAGAAQEHDHWIKAVIADGNPWGMTAMGTVHHQGLGSAPDAKKAAYWFRRAAEASEPTGMMMYGLALLDGKGVDQDEAAGVGWLERAAKARVPDAHLRLAELYRDGRAVPRNWAIAYRHFAKAGRLGLARGSFEAAVLLMEGRLGQDQIPQGITLMKKLAREGYGPARAALRGWTKER